MQKRSWKDLSQRQRTALLVAGTIEGVVTAVALADLARRPAEQVRGPKVAWALACFVQPVGPLGYLVLGRR